MPAGKRPTNYILLSTTPHVAAAAATAAAPAPGARTRRRPHRRRHQHAHPPAGGVTGAAVSLTSTSCSSCFAAAAAVTAGESMPGSAAAILRNSALMLNPALALVSMNITPASRALLSPSSTLTSRPAAPPVRLVPHQHDDHVAAALRAHLVDPPRRVQKARPARHVIHHHRHRAVADVRWDQRAEALLPGRVPQLQPHRAVLQVHRLGQEVDADSGLVAVVELVVHEARNDRRLSHRLIPQKDQLIFASGVTADPISPYSCPLSPLLPSCTLDGGVI
eukprot:CAMPEP_0181373696 /NCGR_PEP_ID=MMETSP1106-20121128/15543_1 /TAXON_ID=81844 /ORGANISM="Mantoniella antarctica, Strain SL-175" /LENGTH=277 /DNA_ID=CAMNT_0023491465 /DNA_START=906 /DNA_END=1742 /DNA_ORIENTATION=-